MKHERLQRTVSDIWSCLLALAITIGAVGCMISGLNLEPDSWAGLLLTWTLTAALCCLCTRIRWGFLLLMSVAAVSSVLLYLDGTILSHLEAMIYRISVVYDNAYHLGTVNLGGGAYQGASLDMALGLVGCLCVTVCTAAFCAKASAFPCIVMGFLPLATCMVVSDTPPGEGWLFLLLTAFLLVMVTSTVRRRSREDGLRLGAILLIPAILAVSLTFYVAPSQEYRDRVATAQDTLLSWVNELFTGNSSSDGGEQVQPGIRTDSVDLTGLGPNPGQSTAVMTVSSTYSGVIYLRGQSYDEYDGKSWSNSNTASYPTLEWPGTAGRTEIGQITISTRQILPLRYFPYYPGGDTWIDALSNGYMANPASQTKYTFRVTELNEQFYAGQQPSADSPPVSEWLPSASQNLRLPDSAKQAAVTYLRTLDLPDVDARTKAQLICQAVSESARYSLNTPQMPADARDFAIWFLVESDTGYCVHYATAAVVLLRAAGIPARYVTGYARQVTMGRTVTVSASHAHAWVEYYDEVTGCWRPLDPTPVGPGSTNPNPPEPDPTEPPTSEPPETEPPETEPPTTETTAPDTPVTDPVESTPPSDQTQPVDGDDPAPDTEHAPQWDIPWGWVLSILSGAALLVGQDLLRRKLRKKKLSTGTPNARALAYWRLLLRYGRILKTKPPESLLELAEKARFSQHTLTDEELAQFAESLTQVQAQLKKRPLPARIFWRLVLSIE